MTRSKPHTRQTRCTRPQLTPSTYLAETLRTLGYSLGGQGSGRSTNGIEHADFVLKYHRHDGSCLVRSSLQTILAEYLLHAAPLLATEDIKNDELDLAIARVFDPSSVRYLNERGYDVQDVISWAWVLTSDTSDLAVSRLLALEADNKTARVPSFLTLFLLRKSLKLDSNVFRLLLIQSIHLITGRPLPALQAISTEDVLRNLDLGVHRTEMNVMTCGKLVDRLIFHARQVWTESLPVIAHAFSQFLKTEKSQHAQEGGEPTFSDHKPNKLKTKLFNACLWHLSIPSSVYPFRSIFIHQQAQFELLRVMATHKPVLPITRKGYRGITAVQMAHKKTTAERQAAALKAPSWPPWKEERLGIDSQRGNEGAYSRAISVLSQMRDAGYSHQLWEEFNKILAGWDTDGSPTVQIRTLSPRSQHLLAPRHQPSDRRLWAARIRATRTLREAWACFLSYRGLGSNPEGAVYTAMAERLVRGRKLAWSEPDDYSDALPGDGPEVYPEPSSVRDVIYVHTEPPTAEAFLEEMQYEGIRYSDRLLSLLLQTAPSFQAGLDYLQNSHLTEQQVTGLCTIWKQGWQYRRHTVDAVQGVPAFVFASFIRFLCRYSEMSTSIVMREVFVPFRRQNVLDSTKRHDFGDQAFPLGAPVCLLTDLAADSPQKYYPGLLHHAIRLLKGHPSLSPSAWHNLIASFGYSRVFRYHSTDEGKCLYRIVVWHATIEVLNWMQRRSVDCGPEVFYLLCRAFTQAVDAGTKRPELLLATSDLNGPSHVQPNREESMQTLVEDGLSILKRKFDGLALPNQQLSSVAQRSSFVADGAGDKSYAIPKLLHIPDYAALHAFARALGTVGDDEGLLDLLSWMSQFSASLDELSEQRHNGPWMRQQTLLAVRVFLERLHNSPIDLADSVKVQKAHDIVSETPGWIWPTDEDVDDYLSRSHI